MKGSELSIRNYKRISVINWVLSVPLIILFGWPYLFIANFLKIEIILSYAGAFFFALPLTLTILHGHVTMALGSLHRNLYYRWLEEKVLTYGLFFHPMFTRTRFRLILLVISGLVLLLGWIIEF